MLTRRQFAAGSLWGAANTLRAQASGRPNVLFIAVDDLNDWIGCLKGYPGMRTPNFDRLAARGTLFTNCHCNAPLCNPSRASLLTGLRPSTTGVYTNNQPFRLSTVGKDAVTLGQYFRRHGYRVVGGGKIYHGAYPDPESWDEYFPSQTKNKPDDPEGESTAGAAKQAHFDWGSLDLSDSEMGDAKVAAWAAGELEKRHSQPLFLACGLYKPHLPWFVPRKYFEMHPLEKITLPRIYPDDLDDIPPIGRKFALASGDHERVTKAGKWAQAVQAYLACISFADAMLGRVLDALDRGPNRDNTVIVLWSDHGWHLGEKLHWRKFTLWEETTRNVFMMSVPGLTKPGSQCLRTVSLIDVYPTLVDLCGLPPRPQLEGVSLKPLLANPAAEWDRPVLTTYQRGNHAIRDERWRYIRYKDGTEELYDRKADAMEWRNLAGKAEFQAVKERLAKGLPQTDAPESPVRRVSGLQ